MAANRSTVAQAEAEAKSAYAEKASRANRLQVEATNIMEETASRLQSAFKSKMESLQEAVKLYDLAWVQSADPHTAGKELESLLNKCGLIQEDVGDFEEQLEACLREGLEKCKKMLQDSLISGVIEPEIENIIKKAQQ